MRRFGSLALLISLVAGVVWVEVALAQETTTQPARSAYQAPVYVSSSDAPAFMSFGVGLGIPYGTLGGRLGVGSDVVGVDAALGLVPLVWKPGVSISASLYATGRSATVRPKATLAYSNTVAMIAILEEGSLDPVYSKTYGGLAAYVGVDWRLSKTSPFGIDLCLGAIFPSDGMDQVKEDFEEVKQQYQNQGYNLQDFSEPRSFPFLSIGLTICPAREMRPVMPGRE